MMNGSSGIPVNYAVEMPLDTSLSSFTAAIHHLYHKQIKEKLDQTYYEKYGGVLNERDSLIQTRTEERNTYILWF